MSKYCSHSFRIGAATTAAKVGIRTLSSRHWANLAGNIFASI